MQIKYFKNTKIMLVVFATILFLAVLVWGYYPYANNPVQNKNLTLLHKKLSSLEVKDADEKLIQFSQLRVYVPACRLRLPIIDYSDCLPLLIEGKSKIDAIENAKKIGAIINSNLFIQDLGVLKSKYAVLIPAVRDSSFSGSVNPYNASKFFSTSSSFIVNLGE